MIIIPPQDSKKWLQTNEGGFFGNLKQTKNISFDRKGFLTLEKRTRLLSDSQTYTDLTTNSDENITAIVQASSGKYWIGGTDTLYYTDGNLALTKDVTASTPTATSSESFDLCTFNAAGTKYLIAVKGATAISKYDGATWTTSATDLAASVYQTVRVFENLSSIAVSSDNKVQLLNSSFTKGTLLTLPANYMVTSMDWNNNRMYIGTLDNLTKEAMIFEWDGTTAEASVGKKVGAQIIFSVKRYLTGVCLVTSRGRVLFYDGSLSKLGDFPIFYNEYDQMSYETTIAPWQRVITNNGMLVDNDQIFIGINQPVPSRPFGDDTSLVFRPEYPSGIWCYNQENGLHQKYTVDGSIRVQTGAITTANVDTTTNIITIPSSICPDTGTPVFYDDAADGSGTLIAPLKFNTRYFVIKLSGTTLKLALTKADALAGTAIDLTSTGNNSQTLSFCPNDGFGGIAQSVSALCSYRQGLSETLENSKAIKMLIGSRITKSSTGSEYTGLHTIEFKQENRGYFITPKLQSASIKDFWQKMYLKFNPLVNEQDKIIVKYRTTEPNVFLSDIYITSYIVPGIWATSTTFTTTDTNIADVPIGYEVEICIGEGSGYLAHITNISAPSGGVYTVTIDETMENFTVGNKFQFVVNNWSKLNTFTSSSIENNDGYAEIPIGKQSKWIQFKIELRGEDVSIEELQIINKTDKPSA